MVPEDLSVAEAARSLGVSSRRIRQLLGDGTLPGRHVGRAWLVPAAAVAELGSRKHRAGRPPAPLRAWALLDILDGGHAPWLEKVARSQVRAQLASLENADAQTWRAALRGREDRRPISGHRAAVGRLCETHSVWPAGPGSARRARADLVVIEAVPEFYVPAELWDDLAGELRLRPAVGQADAYVRVPRGRWPFRPDGPGRAVLAASLLDTGDWRTARAGAEVLNEIVRQARP